MKIKLLFYFLICCVGLSFSQQTVKIRKENTQLYKGAEGEISNWYIYKSGLYFYLCPLNISKTEVEDWFKKRMNSQNIYKGQISEGQNTILSFRKENDPSDIVKFYYKKVKNKLELISSVDGKSYTFESFILE